MSYLKLNLKVVNIRNAEWFEFKVCYDFAAQTSDANKDFSQLLASAFYSLKLTHSKPTKLAIVFSYTMQILN